MTKREPHQPDAKVPFGHPFFEIIEEAYLVFAVPRPVDLGVWDYALDLDPAFRRDFLKLPIAEMPYRCIRDWFHAPVDPPGIARSTWVYFLPRVLEIMALGRDVSDVCLETTLKRYETGNPDNWSAAQWAVLDRFQRLYLQYAMGPREDNMPSSDYETQLDTVLCMFRLGGWSLDSLLEQVSAMSDAFLVDCLWRDGNLGEHSCFNKMHITTFWPASDQEQVFAFFTSPGLSERIEALALADDTPHDLADRAVAVGNVILVSRLEGP